MILSGGPRTMGERLRMYRYRKNMTIKELAEIVNVTPATIRNYERDVTMPNINRLCAISSALDITINMLMYGHEPEEKYVPLIPTENPRS